MKCGEVDSTDLDHSLAARFDLPLLSKPVLRTFALLSVSAKTSVRGRYRSDISTLITGRRPWLSFSSIMTALSASRRVCA